jgi:hypothetical protein
VKHYTLFNLFNFDIENYDLNLSLKTSLQLLKLIDISCLQIISNYQHLFDHIYICILHIIIVNFNLFKKLIILTSQVKNRRF